MPNMREISLEEFHSLHASATTSVFAFGAPWCKDCVRAQPWLEALAAKYPEVGFFHIDVDANEDARASLNIRHIPTIFLARSGTEFGPRVVEPTSAAQLESWLQSALESAKEH